MHSQNRLHESNLSACENGHFQAVSTQIRPFKAKSAFLSQFDVLNKNRDFPSVLKVVRCFIVAKTAFSSQLEVLNRTRQLKSVFSQISPLSVVRHFLVAKTAFLSQFVESSKTLYF